MFPRRIVQNEAQNSMSIGNLAIIFGPTLFPTTAPNGVNGQDGLAGATIQNKVRVTDPITAQRGLQNQRRLFFRRLRPFSNTTPIYLSTSLKSHESGFLHHYFMWTSTYITIRFHIPLSTVSVMQPLALE
jgi:hypothetical protein